MLARLLQSSSLPLASSLVRDRGTPRVEQVDLDRTPDQQLDSTPVYGSLEDSLEWTELWQLDMKLRV